MTMNNANPYTAPQSDVAGADGPAFTDVKILGFSGRLGRVRYVAYTMSLMLIVWFGGGIFAALAIPAMASSGDEVYGAVAGIVMLAVYAFMVVAMFVLAVRRLNDFDASGWLSLLFLVPLVNFFFGIALWFIPGTQGANRYGSPTPPNGGGVTVLAVLMPIVLLAYVGIMAAVAIPAYNEYVERAAQMQRR